MHRPAPPAKDKQKLTAIAQRLAAQRAAVRSRFEQDGKASRYLRAHSAALDEAVSACFALTTGNHPSLSVVALGGYGRCELFPHSDIDLLVLTADETPETLAQAEDFIRAVWDLGVKVGHACRSVNESLHAATSDHTIATALLDARHVCGCMALSDALMHGYESALRGVQPASFIQAKLAERAARHARFGDSRLYLEPNIKETKGGLRDLHSLYWMARDAYGARSISDLVTLNILTPNEARHFRQAQFFLARIRIWLHLTAGRAEDRLGFDIQPLIAQKMGYTQRHDPSATQGVERFMQRYFRTARMVGHLTRLFCALLEEAHKRSPAISQPLLQERLGAADGFRLQGQRLMLAPDTDLAADPVQMLRLFHLAQSAGLDIHPQALHRVTQSLAHFNEAVRHDPEARALFIAMLCHRHAEITLRRLNEAGVLGAFLPEFERIVGQMQYDRYHRYTVDEHTLRAIGIFHSIASGEPLDELPLACELAPAIASPRLLLLALLCHDIAKGSGGSHEARGAVLAGFIARRMGFSDAEADDVAWLVAHQMWLTDHALSRDLTDPKTIQAAAQPIQSIERLRMLLLLSVCDMRAVGQGVWNRWKGALLRELYYRLLTALGGHAPHTALMSDNCGAIDQQAHTQLADFMAQETPLTMHHRIDTTAAVTHLTVLGRHAPNLLTLTAGCLAAYGASIIRARSLTPAPSVSLVQLEIQNAGAAAFDDLSKLRRCEALLAESLHNPSLIDPLLEARRKTYREAPADGSVQVLFDNHSSEPFTLIEVSGPDRIGFLYLLCRTLHGLKLSIATAHITTYGTRAVDVLYVRDRFGLKVERPALLTHIRQSLTDVLGLRV